jgi:hypothetical protein
MLKVDFFITKLIDGYISLLTTMYSAEKREMHNKTSASYGVMHCFISDMDSRVNTLQSPTGPVQGQNRVFPVYFSHTGKSLFSLQGSQVIKTGFSLLGKLHREIPVFITGMGLQCIDIINTLLVLIDFCPV